MGAAQYPVIGQLVKCVRDDWYVSKNAILVAQFPKLGRIYEIREVQKCFRGTHSLFLYFVEIVNPIPKDQSEPAFVADYFHPLDSSALDVFRKAMADPPMGLVTVEDYIESMMRK